MGALFRPTKGVIGALVAGMLALACQGILGIEDGKARVTSADMRACSSRSDCGGNGEICLFGVCSQTCRLDGDCPAGFRCLKTDTDAACVDSRRRTCPELECPSGTICTEKQCRSTCGGSATCADDQTCSAANLCVGNDTKRDPGILDAGAQGSGGASGGAAGSGGNLGNGGAGGHDASVGSGGTGGRDASVGTGGVIGSNAGGTTDGGNAGAGGASGSGGGLGTGGSSGSGGGGPACATDCSSLTDQCNTGTCEPGTGTCKAVAIGGNIDCDDGDPCTVGEKCTADANDVGRCVGGTPKICDDKNPCTDDSCQPNVGCKVANNALSCDDKNPCTINDKCSGGICQSTTQKNCSDSNPCTDDSCLPSDTTGSPCRYANNTLSCTDGDSCTQTDTCAGGLCTGTGNACGTTNVAKCTQGSPNTCACNGGFIDSGNGKCVPPNDECQTPNSCSTVACGGNATCNDPTATCGDRTCACLSGYAGNPPSVACANINECTGNPCGSGNGTCTENAPGQGYSCGCNTGFMSVDATADSVNNPKCVCDMNGTFAVRVTADVQWPATTGVEPAAAEAYTWALRTHTYDSAGNLTVQTEPCGSYSPDVCTPTFSEAYGVFLTNQMFGTAQMPVGTLNMPLPQTTAAYNEPQVAALLGISLTNPLGAWPATRSNVGTGGSQTNGATWTDPDADAITGVTLYSVPSGGIAINSSIPDPPYAYPANSPDCPRSSGAARWPYKPWVGLENLTARRITKFYVGMRTISQLQGTIAADCNSISGVVKGPVSGQMQTDARFQGCADDSPDTVCAPTLVDYFDSQSKPIQIQPQNVVSATFTMKRVPNNHTCTDVRNTDLPKP